MAKSNKRARGKKLKHLGVKLGAKKPRNKAKEKGRIKVQYPQIKKYVKLGQQPKWYPRVAESKEFALFLEIFLKHIFNKPYMAGLNYEEKLEVFFGTKVRDIVPCYALMDFKINGLLQLPGEMRPPLISEQTIPFGTPLFVRIDERTPDRVDVQPFMPGFPEDAFFNLTAIEFKVILPAIGVIGNDHKRLTGKKFTRKARVDAKNYKPSSS